MAYIDSTTASGNSDTPSVAVPAGVAADDIVIIACAIDMQSAVFDTGDWPSGFTELAETDITADGHSVAIGWKRLTGADSGTYTFGSLGATGDWVCQAVALSGRHVSNPPIASTVNVQNTPQSSPVTVSANGVTAVDGDDLVWVSAPDVTSSGAGNGHTAPTNFTEREDAENAWANLSIATRENVSAGATGTVSGTFALSQDTAGWAAWLIRIPLAGEPPQKAHPDSDESTGSWTTTTLFSKVDETSPDDGDFITSASAPSNDTCELGLTDLTDPTSSSDHILRIRRKKSAASNNQIDMRYRLLEGATEIASITDDTNISESAFTTIERTLSGGQADAITDYTDLRVEIRANQVAGGGDVPTFVAAGAIASTATSGADITPALPAGFAADDIHIIVCHHSGSLDFATPSGWTKIAALSGTNTSAQIVATFWRRAVGGDTAPAISMASPDNVTTVRAACCYGFRGCITTGDPWDSGSGAGPTKSNNAASATVATTSITTTVANCLVVFFDLYEDDPSTRSLPSGYTATGTVGTTATGTDCAIAAHRKALSGTGTENPSTTVSGGTFANSVNVGLLIALKPVPPADVSAQVSWVEFEVPGVAGGGATEEYFATGTITPAGALALSVARNRAYAGTITPAGALSRVASILRAYTGTITPAGLLASAVTRLKSFTATITPAGLLASTKVVVRAFTATITPAGALTTLKALLRSFTGTITPAGALAKAASIARGYTATITPAGALNRVASFAKSFTATITPSGLFARAVSRLRAYAGTITPAGAFVGFKVIVRSFAATITPVGAFIKIGIKGFAGLVTPAGALNRTASFVRVFTATVEPAGALFKTIFKKFTATITAVGAALVGLFGVADSVNVTIGDRLETRAIVNDRLRTQAAVSDRIKTETAASDELGN